jgi:hypothetical protein
MTLTRQNETIKPLNRPQTPKAPLITLPKKLVFKTSLIKYLSRNAYLRILQKFSILVMITGSGSQNRDEELLTINLLQLLMILPKRNRYATT